MKRLTKDKKLDHVRLVMKFKDDYPFSPPFVRIVYPRFKRSTGYIIDGAFCMELLTNQVNEKTKENNAATVSLALRLVFGSFRFISFRFSFFFFVFPSFLKCTVNIHVFRPTFRFSSSPRYEKKKRILWKSCTP